ncbi:hypothetical protein V1264_006185 [Littorina saxatilis]|uniref:Uncharacterized protein n=1 Tax=Littorina saxatilis TaxID=31220 RepID=A0AAN9AWF0_9CAEN
MCVVTGTGTLRHRDASVPGRFVPYCAGASRSVPVPKRPGTPMTRYSGTLRYRDASAPGRFGTGTLRYRDASAPGRFGTGTLRDVPPTPCYFMFDMYSYCTKVTALPVTSVP